MCIISHTLTSWTHSATNEGGGCAFDSSCFTNDSSQKLAVEIRPEYLSKPHGKILS
jgi:hypothetical protein